MVRKGRGKGPPEKDGGNLQAGASRGHPMSEDYASATMGVQLWPMTPLGVPADPPPIPPLPPYLLPAATPALPAAATAAGYAANGFGPGAMDQLDNGLCGDGIGAPAVPPLPDCIFGAPQAEAQAHAAAQQRQQDDWEFETRADRRTFFHTEGKTQTFRAVPNQRHTASEFYEHGSKVTLDVEEIHFGNPRVGVMSANPAPMNDMFRWQPSEFAKHQLECAQIAFGDYWVWCAVGIPSNRLLYAAKRNKNLRQMNSVVVPPPRIAKGAEEDIDLTYGASIQGIQLVPM